MANPHPMVELWRGGLLESTHSGHAVIWGPDGIEEAWGDPTAVIFPRSSCKMIQALPLVETGAADAAGLTEALVRSDIFVQTLTEKMLTYFIKKALNLKSGSKLPGKESAGTITQQQVREIAEKKMSDLNAYDIEQAASMIAGSARSMGIQVEG